MLDHMDSDSSVQTEEKLILPAPPDEEPLKPVFQQRAQVYPGLLIRQKTPPAPKKILPKLVWYWRKDPAYKVFMIALVMVALAAVVFVSLAGSAIFSPSNPGPYPQAPSAANVAPTGTVDLKPGFSTPNGGKGSTQSSQPPAQNTPVLSSTPTTVQSGGPISLQITDYTHTVANGNSASVTVSTNQPGITITLQIRYSGTVFGQNPGAQTTDGNGNATFSWPIYLISNFGHRSASAEVTAYATDQNGQSSHSNSVKIQIKPS